MRYVTWLVEEGYLKFYVHALPIMVSKTQLYYRIGIDFASNSWGQTLFPSKCVAGPCWCFARWCFAPSCAGTPGTGQPSCGTEEMWQKGPLKIRWWQLFSFSSLVSLVFQNFILLTRGFKQQRRNVSQKQAGTEVSYLFPSCFHKK